jgi:hypothetical protein
VEVGLEAVTDLAVVGAVAEVSADLEAAALVAAAPGEAGRVAVFSF